MGASDTPTRLAGLIADEIAREGPISLARYMTACLGHGEHGYYMTRDPFGQGGDFVTAPEISQMFGEMLGLWCADMWQKIGSPPAVALVELGPGRGTLMADMVRAARVVPAFSRAIDVHLVETSRHLRDRQRETLAGHSHKIHWHDRLAQVPEAPMLLVANELFDALPVHQLEYRPDGWRERLVDVGKNGTLGFTCPPRPAPPHLAAAAPGTASAGDIFEVAPAGAALAREIGQRLARHPCGALIVDYGHATSALGESFQAVKAHKFVSPFAAPGDADLTAHVDFQSLRDAACRGGATAYGPMEMGMFLEQLGLDQRAARLADTASEPAKQAINAAYRRLTQTSEMGSLFKVLALTSPGVTIPAPFAPAHRTAPNLEPL